MATIISTTFSALAFAGAGWLFQHLDKNGYKEEPKRHDVALEQLTRDQEKWT